MSNLFNQFGAYMGNVKLKKPGVQIQWTKELIDEYVLCQREPMHFIKKHVKIIHVDKGIVSFDLWPFQEDIVQKTFNNRFVIVKTPRQVGKTTTTAAIILWHILFNANYSVAILAHKEKQSKEILGRIKLMYEHLPKWLQLGVIEWNKSSIELSNGSKVLASSTSSSAIRGTTQNLIYLDEFAHVPPHIQDEFFSSVYPTISSGVTTKVIITSTPKGMNKFYKIWHDAENKKNTYIPISVHWSAIPGRDEAWKEETIRNTSKRQFREEFEAEFLGSENTLIDPSKLSNLPHEDPLSASENTDIFEAPLPGHVYMITVDTSRGVALDHSAFIVFDITQVPYKVVAKYRNNTVPALIYPQFIYNAAKAYNDAYVLVETNDVGAQVADILHSDMEYEGMVWTKSNGRTGIRMSLGLGEARPVLGVRTTTSTKRIGCANLKTLIESDRLIINDYDVIQELFRFVEKTNGTFSAEEGEHDDLVMCCVMFAWMVNQPSFRELTDTNARASVVDQARHMISENVLPFGYIDMGPVEETHQADPNEDWWMWVDDLNKKDPKPDAKYDGFVYGVPSNVYKRPPSD